MRAPAPPQTRRYKMNRANTLTLWVALMGAGMDATFAAQSATREEAQAMVKKAIVFIKDHGLNKAYAEISNRDGQFVDRDLYVVVYDLGGKVLAHGGNVKLVGKDMIDAQDVD